MIVMRVESALIATDAKSIVSPFTLAVATMFVYSTSGRERDQAKFPGSMIRRSERVKVVSCRNRTASEI